MMLPMFLSRQDDPISSLIQKKLQEAISNPEVLKLIEDQLDLYIKERLPEEIKKVLNSEMRNHISSLFYEGKPDFLKLKDRIGKHFSELPELDSIISQEVRKITADTEFFRGKIRDIFKNQLTKLIEEVSEKVEQRRVARKASSKSKKK